MLDIEIKKFQKYFIVHLKITISLQHVNINNVFMESIFSKTKTS